VSLPPPAGAAILFWDGDAPSFAVVVGEEKQRVAIVSETGREERIPASRVAFELDRGTAPLKTVEGRRLAAARAAALRGAVSYRAREVDVGTLWDLVRDRPDPVPDRELAGIALGTDEPLSRAAVVVALAEDGVRFQRRGSEWMPRASGTLEKILAERERVAVLRRERESVVKALVRAWRGEGFVPTGLEIERRTLAALEGLAILDADAPDRETAQEALAAIGVTGDRPHEAAFRLLRRTGQFDSDDRNLAIDRYGLREEFPEEVRVAAEEAARRGFVRDGRKDLTSLDMVTIDAPFTLEVDDALSIAPWDEGGFEIGVHIADPCAFVPVGSPVDREAFARGMTYYFPERKLLMLPPAISEGAASLVAGEERPALSFLARVDADGRIRGFEILSSVIRVGRRLDYDTVDTVLAGGVDPHALLLRTLARFGDARESARKSAGAIILRSPEVEVHVDASGSLALSRRDPRSPSQRIVAEAMVLAGEVAAAWLESARVPAIYRRQAAPDGPLPAADPEMPEIVWVRAVRRMLKRGEAGREPSPHSALGIAAYAQVTSPLRRYQDLAMHRQMTSVLGSGSPAYLSQEMQAILATTERAELDGRRAERMADRYWMLKYLLQRTGETVTAVVAEIVPRTIVVLDETLLEEPVPALSGAALGDRVRLRIERVNPRADLLVLRPS
jgi:exoribonuclease-2